jgi:hypothetical protein
MASKLPIIHFHTEKDIIDKMKFIAKQNSRSLSKETELSCKIHIKEYEDIHGEIKLTEE